MSVQDHSPRPGPALRVGMVSLGCPKNRVDSEIMLGRLSEAGHELTLDVADADVVIVNTCGFIDEAKQESIDTILELSSAPKGRGQDRRLLVAGCMVNRYGPELESEIPEIDGFISLDDLDDSAALVGLGEARPAPRPAASLRVFDHRSPRRLTTPGYGYLKVAEGCDNPCTFCAIPSWRGRFRSRSIESLLAEAQALEATGVVELCLVAQDTTRYGQDLGLGRHGLLRLVEALLTGTGFPWIRFLYAYPTTLDRDLLRLMGSEERFCSYLDIPLQHAHEDILRSMRRGGSADSYLRLLDEARSEVPDISLRTTFIIGFPGETEAHFGAVVDLVDAARFDHLGAFVYSSEDGTPAAGLADPVAREVAEERRQRLLELQQPIALASRRRLVGRELEVLVEGVCDETEHLLVGRHQGMAPEVDGRLLLADGASAPGSLARVRITEAFADDLVGHILVPEPVAD